LYPRTEGKPRRITDESFIHQAMAGQVNNQDQLQLPSPFYIDGTLNFRP
jgi:hypothetical protein